MAKGKKRRKKSGCLWILFKFLIFVIVVLCIGWFGLKFYFTNVNKIDDKIRASVNTSIEENNSKYLSYNEIPEMYRNALIATEERNFLTNPGIDPRGIARAIYVDIKSREFVQGGSSITQQLVHNTLLDTRPKQIQWKLLEGVYAIGVYDTMNKEETLTLYSNVVYFGHGAYGLYMASEKYFKRAPSELNAGELTMLAGLPNSPSNYDPYNNYILARERQKQVIQSMVDSKVITEAEGNDIFNKQIRLK
jgi:Membrane carboxypeptidase (penicillin-binding protein)